MYVEHLHIRRFRSLYDVEWNPGHFSVLTGPNGSGKTNLVEAMAFLGEVYQYGIDYAVGRAGGIDAIAFRGKRRTTIGVQFTVDARVDVAEIARARVRRTQTSRQHFEALTTEDYITISHSFTVKPGNSDSSLEYSVAGESVTIVAHSPKLAAPLEVLKASVSNVGEDAVPEAAFAHLDEDDGFADYISDAAVGFFRRNLEIQVESFGSAGAATLSEWLNGAPAFRLYRQRMSRIKAYRLSPRACREPGVLTPTAALESHGANLPAAVARLSKEFPDAWQQVLASMRQIMPELEAVVTRTSAEYGLVLGFQETGKGRPWSAGEVSDGTIQALALLLALHDPRQPLILIEEPENAVHPWVLRRILEQSRRENFKQVIITTHSPVVLKLVRPDDVFIVWRTGGKTRLKPLGAVLPDAQRLYTEEGFDVFDLYDSGLIEEATPGSGVQR